MDIKIQRYVADQALKICFSNYSSVEVRKVKSGVICAALCVHQQSCCSSGFDKQTGECFLDHACFPECVPSQNATFVRKVTFLDKSEDYETTVSEITSEKTTKMAITSERAIHNATTSKRTTNHDTTMEKLTSQKPASNGLDMTSERTTLSVTTSERTTNHGTTMERLTTQKPTSNGLDMTSERTTLSFTTRKRTTNHGTTMEKLTTQKPTSNGPDCSGVTAGSSSGVYTIYVDNQPLDVYCEMAGSDQWTVFQRRIDGSTDFYRTWQEYKQGFGNVNSEFWLGNDNLHKILSTGNFKLRIDLEDWNGEKRYAEYDTFVVGNEATKYVLTIASYNGNAGDSLSTAQDLKFQLNGYGFTTWDRDNDESPHINCGVTEHSGWWFNWCTAGNLNGKYYNGGVIESDGIYWEAWTHSEYSLKSVSMKIKQI
ncbi:angiopoietin-1-like [Mytilus trossulus]|uniref:angiopoietin-1-like n=1 Tax=Mytilus trossulus TaxID=6551 RepID=UPI003005CE6E